VIVEKAVRDGVAALGGGGGSTEAVEDLVGVDVTAGSGEPEEEPESEEGLIVGEDAGGSEERGRDGEEEPSLQGAVDVIEETGGDGHAQIHGRSTWIGEGGDLGWRRQLLVR